MVKRMQIPDDVRAIFNDETMVEWDQEQDRTTLVIKPLDRKDYDKVKRVITDLGGKWDKKTQKHWFDYDPLAEVDAGEYSVDNDFFQTPFALALEMAEYVKGYTGMVVDPSAGLGVLPRAVKQACPEERSGLLVDELDPRRREELAKEFVVIEEPEGHNFLDSSYTPTVFIMNPPWSNYASVHHVKHAWNQVQAGGRVIALLSEAHWTSTHTNAIWFRGFLERLGDQAMAVEIGEWEFKGQNRAGKTVQRCRILILDKPMVKCTKCGTDLTPAQAKNQEHMPEPRCERCVRVARLYLSSTDYCKRYLKEESDLEILRAAWKGEKADQDRKTMIQAIESRIRKVSMECGAVPVYDLSTVEKKCGNCEHAVKPQTRSVLCDLARKRKQREMHGCPLWEWDSLR